MNLEKEVFDISIEDIMPNRFQPREMFDETALQELADSIKEHGVIQPIIVRKVGDKYEIIAGERRYRASKLANQKTVPAIVKDMDDKEAAKVALLENLQRQDLTAIEEAKTYQTILKLDNMTQEELAINLGKSQSTIANKLRLLQLDEEVQTALLNNKISERHARSLLEVKNPERQRQLLNQIIMNRWTVKQLDDEIAGVTNNNFAVNNQQSNQNDTSYTTVDTKVDENVFNKLRVDNPNPVVIEGEQNHNQPPHTKQDLAPFKTFEKPTQPKIKNQQPIQPESPTIVNPVGNNPYGDVYDMRFAINNVRQAIQNTKKFGFAIETEEFDFENIYQIIIKIDKNKIDNKF